MQANYPLVSIVIPMLNEISAIERCIRSIKEQDYPQDRIEILVVDGLSTDGSRERVLEMAKAAGNLRLLDNPAKRTPISLNLGAKNSRGEVVIILGAHTRIKSDFVRLNIHYLQTLKVPCVGGTQINTGDTFMQTAIGYAMGSRFGIPSAPYRFDKKARFVDTVVYAAYKKELFEQVGYFDEELHIAEDAEFNWRIRRAGHKIYFTPDIVSYYYPRKNLVQLAKQFFNYGILRVNVVKKHGNAVKLLHLIPPSFLLISLLLAGWGLWQPAAWRMLAGLWLVYALYVAAASFITARQNHTIAMILVLPLVFMVMQISWAAGFLTGIVKTH
ncbi:glycosyltransferase family 2 protein [bacterium]|nr:glycosyltransferase family 2 protein [bacterium]